jgi:hypothetical protein
MGMSAQSSKLVPQLKAAGFIEHSIFALCFERWWWNDARWGGSSTFR